jgi:hypothetical protein
MARIICRTPSTGRAIRVSLKDVGTTFVTIADAPDFSVPDAAEQYSTRDPSDAARAIRPGEIFFLTPLSATNKGVSTQWIEAQLLAEDGTTIQFGRVEVPSGDTAFIPLQGRSLFKRTASGTNGDRLQIRAQSTTTFDVWAAAEEKLSAEHAGVVS